MERQNKGCQISTNSELLNISFIHDFLCRHAYWAVGIPEETVRRSIEGSLCFGIYKEKQQIGFARVISDYATFAYLADVFITPEFQGNGYGKLLLQAILAHPKLQGLRRWMLVTGDAHGLYKKFGFTSPAHPERIMEIARPGLYLQNVVDKSLEKP
ncbi:MAG: GNAT family N-acetyltransferase [Lewinellaceae bacterium]|nr:GNAT family N-acetyltransferase [Lewinellaceae bacterium]